VPGARNGILTGVALSFAHTMGEFGVVLMLGGNIPGVTRVASIALYDETQTLNYAVANSYALVLLGLSCGMLFLIAALREAPAQQPKLRWAGARSIPFFQRLAPARGHAPYRRLEDRFHRLVHALAGHDQRRRPRQEGAGNRVQQPADVRLHAGIELEVHHHQ